MTHSDGTIACVGGLAYDEAGRLLLVQRANEPGRGLWSVPGGRVEPGEDDAAALVREMHEETGLLVTPGALVGRVVRGPSGIADYRWTGTRWGSPARGHARHARRTPSAPAGPAARHPGRRRTPASAPSPCAGRC